MMALQGFESRNVQWKSLTYKDTSSKMRKVSRRLVNQCLGNAVSVNVAGRILVALMRHVGFICARAKDPWEYQTGM